MGANDKIISFSNNCCGKMLENILGNIELRKSIPKQKITQSKTRPAWAGFKTAEEGRTKIM